MPRPFDHELRSHFESTEVPRKSRCRHCSSEILNHAGSLKRHLNDFCKEYVGDGQYRNNEAAAASVPRNSRSSMAATEATFRAGGYGNSHSDLHLLSNVAAASSSSATDRQQQKQSRPPRKAQQQARKHQATQIRGLEQQVLGLQTELQRVRRENEILRGRQAHIQHVVASWTDFTGPGIGFGGSGGDVVGMEQHTRNGGAPPIPPWGPNNNNNNNRPGTADAPGDIDNEREGENGTEDGANRSRNSPLFTP